MRLIFVFSKPRVNVLGSNYAGIVKEVGRSVTTHKNGDKIIAVTSSKNKKLVSSLGADIVIDYNREDFTKLSPKYDFIFDTAGHNSYNYAKASLRPNGKYISVYISENEFR